MTSERRPKVTIVKPPILPIFGRTISLTLALFVSVFTAATWKSFGIGWLYSDNDWPILTCPSTIMSQGDINDGSFCSMELWPSVPVINAVNADPIMRASCTQPLEKQGTIVCNLPYKCDEACHFNGGVCPDPATVPEVTAYGQVPWMCTVTSPTGFNQQIACRQIELMAYCDSTHDVTPGSIVAIRGLLFGAVLICLIWFIAEFVLRSVDITLRRETAEGHLRQKETLPRVKAELRALIERRWAEQYEASKRESGGMFSSAGSIYGGETPRMAYGSESPRLGMTPTAGTPRSGFTMPYRSALESRNPQRRFESSAWQRRLVQWKELRSRKSTEYKSRVLLRSVGLNLLFLTTLVLTMYLILYLSPPKVSGQRSILDTLKSNVSIWEIHSALDVLIFIDVLLDQFLFLIACCVVHWPRAPVFAKRLNQERLKHVPHEGRESTEPGFDLAEQRMHSEGTGSISLSMSLDEEADDDAFSLESVLKQTMTADTCLLIACHQSTLTEEKQAAFTNTLRSAMKVFPPSHIFVCDNGNSMTPVDGTQAVAQSIHPDINYVYIPEGNKTFAFYYVNRYFVPFLAQCGRVPDFRYALITDDDVPLPAELHIPHEYLRLHPEVKAVHFAITAATPDGDPGMLVRCQDIEYKMAAVHKYFQSTMSRALSCHGAIGLWERATLDRVFYDHDTVFHGEDLYMGLSLLRLRDDSRIISCPQTIVPTYAPDYFAMLFRQRVKSWELTSHKKTFSYLWEFINPASFFHAPSLILKPYFLQELLTITLDWLRMFLLAGLVLRDWLGLVIMAAVFTSLLYIQVIILQFIYLRQRKDLRSSFFTVVMFPFYRLSGLLFRLCALCHNILVYSHERKSVKIGKREDEIRDVPPCPPHPDCDWFSVWLDVPQKDQLAR